MIQVNQIPIDTTLVGGFQETTIDFNAMPNIKKGDNFTLQVGDEILEIISTRDLSLAEWLSWVGDNYNSNLEFIANINIDTENGKMKLTGKSVGEFNMGLDLGENE